MKWHPRVELFHDGAWRNHTTDVYTRDEIQVTRGRGDEQSEPTTGTATLTFDNRDGKYNPRNPSSTLYGKIGRNTPVRVSAGTGSTLEDDFNRTVSNGWTGGPFTWTNNGGTVPDDYDVNGTEGTHTHPATNVLHYSTAETGSADHRVRATVNLSAATLTGDHASSWVLARFTDTSNYYAALVTFQTGGDVTIGIFKRVAGVLSAVVGPITTHSGYGGFFDTRQFNIELYVEGAKLYAKIWDSLTPEPLASTLSATDTSLTTGTKAGVVDRRETGNTNTDLQFQYDEFLVVPGTIRFAGEVSSWRPRRAVKGDAWTEITANGVLRRLGQGAVPQKSPVFREATRSTNTAVMTAYWPAEDGVDAAQLASGIGGPAMSVVGGTPSYASDATFPGSAPMLSFGSAPTPVLRGVVPAHVGTSTIKFRMLMTFPAAGFASNQVLADIYTVSGTGTIRVWRFFYETIDGGVLSLKGLDGEFAEVEFSGYIPNMNGTRAMVGFEVTESGADVAWQVASHKILSDGSTFGQIDSGTFTVQTVGRADEVYIGPGGALVDCAVGHFILGTSSTTVDGLEEAITGWTGETAADRMARLCRENAVPFILRGNAADTEAMGPQPIDTLINQFAEIERTDGGLLYETRHEIGLTYRTRVSLYNQAAALALDFDAGHIAPPLDPDIDDQAVRNDVTAKRRDGSSARAVQETGPLNVQRPEDDPDGVGRYETQWDVNPARDDDLRGIAHWRRHLGRADLRRYLAQHEAAHAVAAAVLGAQVAWADLDAGPGYGATLVGSVDARTHAVVQAAGGEQSGWGLRVGCDHDARELRSLVPADQVRDVCAQARALLKAHRPAVLAVAEALEVHGRLSGAEILAVVSDVSGLADEGAPLRQGDHETVLS